NLGDQLAHDGFCGQLECRKIQLNLVSNRQFDDSIACRHTHTPIHVKLFDRGGTTQEQVFVGRDHFALCLVCPSGKLAQEFFIQGGLRKESWQLRCRKSFGEGDRCDHLALQGRGQSPLHERCWQVQECRLRCLRDRVVVDQAERNHDRQCLGRRRPRHHSPCPQHFHRDRRLT